MRLICPNCDAQYDVADDAVPEGGRDVQCSSCSHTWFQTEKPVVPGRDMSKIVKTLLPKTKRETEEKSPTDGETTAPAVPERKPLESSVAEILREEASRANKGPDSDTQPDTRSEALGAVETRKRIAQMTESEVDTRADTAAAAFGAVTADANLRAVPNIHEINAALRARAEASDTSGLTDAEKQEAVQRGGFRRGFFLVLILFAILITPYFFADQITQNLPQTRGFMIPYVETIDQARMWLNAQVGSIAAFIEGFTGGGDVPATETAPTDS